jgi:iron(III) transport system permease protein
MLSAASDTDIGWRSSPRSFLRRIDSGLAICAGLSWVVAAFILALLGLIVWMSFIPGLPGDPGITIENYTDILGHSTAYIAFFNSLIVGAGTVAINLLFAVPMAWLVERTDLPGRSVIVTLIALSILIPGFLKAMGWLLLLSPEIGLVNHLLMQVFDLRAAPFNVYGLGGVIFVQGLTFTPAMFFLISGSMRSCDPTLEEAAQMSGASRAATIIRILAPLLWPAILAALIYNFVSAMSLYEVAALLLGDRIPVLSTELFLNVRSVGGTINLAYAAVYGVVMMAVALGALWLYSRTTRRAERFAVVTGKSYRPRRVALGRWTLLGLAFVAAFLALDELMPILTLLWMSLLPALEMPTAAALRHIDLAQYAAAWRQLGGWPVFNNTIVLTVVSAISVVAVSVAMSLVTTRSTLRGRHLLDGIAMLPHVVPGVAFAFALLVFGILLNRFVGIPLYGSLTIILLGVLVERIPFATRITNAAMLQLHKEIDEGAEICGATRLQTIRRIIVPLIAPSLAYSAVWVALLALREVTIPLLLSGPDNVVVSVRIWTLWATGQYGSAAAIGLSMFVIIAVLMLSIRVGLLAARGKT